MIMQDYHGLKLGWKVITLPNGTFEWLESYEPITYFPFLTRISFRKGRKKYFLKHFNLNINVNVKKY